MAPVLMRSPRLAAAVDGHDRHVAFLAGRLQRLVGAERRRLVDRVDEVDVRDLLEQVLHRAPAASAPSVTPSAIARRPRRRLGLVLDVDAEALEEAVVALDVDGDAVRGEVEHGDLRLLARLLELAPWPTCRSPRRRRSCRSRTARRRRPAGSVCVSSAITGTPAWRALSIDGTIALESPGVIMMPLAPAEIRLSTAATCDLVVAVLLARERLQLGAVGVGGLPARPPSSSRRTGWSRSW